MSESSRAAMATADSTGLKYEAPNVDTWRVLFWAAVVTATVIVCVVISHIMYVRLLRPVNERSITPLMGQDLVLPAEPRLEGVRMMSSNGAANPVGNDEVRLQKYGWVDRDKKIVHIPIQQAMKLAIEQDWLRSRAPVAQDRAQQINKLQPAEKSNEAR
jgi:hypothetical protein